MFKESRPLGPPKTCAHRLSMHICFEKARDFGTISRLSRRKSSDFLGSVRRISESFRLAVARFHLGPDQGRMFVFICLLSSLKLVRMLCVCVCGWESVREVMFCISARRSSLLQLTTPSADSEALFRAAYCLLIRTLLISRKHPSRDLIFFAKICPKMPKLSLYMTSSNL